MRSCHTPQPSFVIQAATTLSASVQCAIRTKGSHTGTASALVLLGSGGDGRERARMEIHLDALALLVERVDLVAAAVLLDAPDLPAFRLQRRGELVLGLPALARARVAGGHARGVGGSDGGEEHAGGEEKF